MGASARTHPARPPPPPGRISASAAGRCALRGVSRSRGKTAFPPHPGSPFASFCPGAMWPGPALSALWAHLPASVTGAGADPPQLQRAVTDRGGASRYLGHLDLRAVLCVGTGRCSGHPQLSSRASSLSPCPFPVGFLGPLPAGGGKCLHSVSLSPSAGPGVEVQAKKRRCWGGGEDAPIGSRGPSLSPAASQCDMGCTVLGSLEN